MYQHYSEGLPDYHQLASYEPSVVTRVHAGDGRLLTEFSIEKRVYVPVDAVPKRLINAFLAAEDKTFYSHPGIDVPGIIKAMNTNVAHRSEMHTSEIQSLMLNSYAVFCMQTKK